MNSVLFGGSLFITLVSYPIWREKMMTQSMEDIPVMQENEKLRGLFTAVDISADEVIFILVLIIAFNTLPKCNALYIWSSYGLTYFSQAAISYLFK